MTDRFRPRYHFVPHREAKAENEWNTSADDFRRNGPPEGNSHAAFANGSHPDEGQQRWSGRIVCRLTTETPLVVGARRREHPSGYQVVEPYLYKGCAAIPASSLKGMISAITEAASGSALRVLDDKRPVSYRKPMPHALHAIGLVVEDGQSETGLSLRPLTLPLIRRNGADSDYEVDSFCKPWRKAFEAYANLKLYVGDYGQNSDPDEFMKGISLDPPQNDPVRTLNTYYYARVDRGGSCRHLLERLNSRSIAVRAKPGLDTDRHSIISQVADSIEIIDHSSFSARSERDRVRYTRGFLRILGIQGRDIPKNARGFFNKKHELFVPYPEQAERDAKILPIPTTVLDTFAFLARERAEATNIDDGGVLPRRRRSPYLPFDTEANEEASWQTFGKDPTPVPRLKAGDLVYFDIAAGKDPVVSAISFSAIWRGAVLGSDGRPVGMHDFFGDEHRPYSNERRVLTPAEWLFGFVSRTGGGDPTEGPRHVAYAGRVRISRGTLENESDGNGVFDQSGDLDVKGRKFTRLKILASPKPPSPNLYFRNRDGGKGAIAKNGLSLAKHEPQGRKAYLHQRPSKVDDPNGPVQTRWQWQTKVTASLDGQAKQKAAVLPVKTHTDFLYHVDFTNLTEREIDLLAFALRPSDGFRHKLGMGKPLGLGSVCITPLALFLCDRKRRYTEDDIFSDPRWHCRSVATNVEAPERYAGDRGLAGSTFTTGLAERSTRFREWASKQWPDAIHALLLLGETWNRVGPGAEPADRRSSDNIPVMHPLNEGQDGDEDETYAWFARNGDVIDGRRGYEAHAAQQLNPIDRDTQALPSLQRLARPTGGDSGRGPRGPRPQGRPRGR